MKKVVMRFLPSLGWGLLMGIINALLNYFSGADNWFLLAFYAGFFATIGHLIGSRT